MPDASDADAQALKDNEFEAILTHEPEGSTEVLEDHSTLRAMPGLQVLNT